MAKDYSKLEKDDLLKVITKLESRKKYGLVWDEEKTKEQFEKESENALPVLKEVKGKEIKTDSAKPTNILIEGDNYHALSVLNYTHQGKIDVIYIDPPYNTGNKDFKYNDRFVDKEDSYRHSKWLSFMSKRLRLAKNLMKEDGVIFISIDDNELAQLKLLCDEIFGEENFIDSIVWDKKSSAKGVPPKNMIVNVHEYIIAYQKGDGFKFVGQERTEESGKFKNPDNDPRGPWRESNIKSTIKPIEDAFTIIDPNTGREYTNTWAFSKKTLEQMIKEERILWKDTLPKQKEFMREMKNENMAIKSNWGVFDAQSTTVFLKGLLPDIKFDNPKPISLMEYLIRVATSKDFVILDFFAGSGTTGHAVALLNKEDGGNRQYILCTNNENGIATEVCYPRIKTVIKGDRKYRDLTGIKGNLKYFKTAFVKNSISRDDLKMRITRECTEMLCLREGIFDEVKAKPDYHIFEQNGRIMGVYYSMERDSLAQLKKEMDKMKGEKILYCFTLDPLGLNKNDFVDWQGVSLEPIPQKILDIYEQIYEY